MTEKSPQMCQINNVHGVKSIPKDGQIITSIMREAGIEEYEPNTIIQLTEFVYRYTTSILEEARMYANNSKKKCLDVEDIRLGILLATESSFVTPPPREVSLECANIKNSIPLPPVKPHCGLRLPPDRYCLSSCNYNMRQVSVTAPPAAPVNRPVNHVNVNGIANVTTNNINANNINTNSINTNNINTNNINGNNNINGRGLKGPINTPIKMSAKCGISDRLFNGYSSMNSLVVRPKIQITAQNGFMPAVGGVGSMMDVDVISSLKRKRDEEIELYS